MKLRLRPFNCALGASVLAAGLALAGQAQAQTFTFDTPAACGGADGELQVSGTCSTNGFTFTELLRSGTFSFLGFAVTADSGATFSMSGFQARNGRPEVDGPTGIVPGQPAPPGVTSAQVNRFTQSISVVGTHADGTSATFTYNNFGSIETLNLGPSFTDLVRVEITTSFTTLDATTFNVTPAGLWSSAGGFIIPNFALSTIDIDNLQVVAAPVAAVPEPSTVVLFGASLLGLGLYRRRDRSITPLAN
jgi:hypothetical protein